MQIDERLRKILGELEEINCELKSKALEKAIENIKIALHGEKIGGEGFEHSYMRRKIVEMIGGNVYVESELTGISKLGYRPDLVIVKGNEAMIVEIETEKRNALRKMKKVSKILSKIKSNPIFSKRILRVIFVLSSWDDDVLRFAKSKGFDVYLFKGDELFKFNDK